VGYVPFVALKVYQLGVQVGVFKFLMAKNLLYILDVFGSMVLHCGFPMAECMKFDLSDSRILKGSCYPALLFVEILAYRVWVAVEYEVACFWKLINHCNCSGWHLDDSGQATFNWVVYSYCA